MCVFSHLMLVYFHGLPTATEMRHIIPEVLEVFEVFSD